MEISPSTQNFIREYAANNPAELRLRFAGKTLDNVDIPFAITQIEARKKVAAKLPWLTPDTDFIFPSGLSAEQCTAQPVADYHACVAGKQKEVLDLTCGLGIDAMTIALHSECVTACDISPIHVECAVHNAKTRGIHNFNPLCVSAEDFLEKMPDDKRFTLIFADPARRGDNNSRTYALTDCAPNIIELMPLIRKHTDMLMVKVSPMLDVTQLLKELSYIKHIYAVSLKGECKELLLVCDFKDLNLPVRYTAVNIDGSGKVSEYKLKADRNFTDIYVESPDDLRPGDWLFEPNASVMKFVSVAPVAATFPGMRKLSKNTNLYIGTGEIPVDLPGRVLRIEKVLSPNKRCAGELPAQVNIVTRNYPDTPEKIKKQFKLKDGGSLFLYCCRVGERTARMLLCSPLSIRI